jgi:hypothetical protein
MRCHCATPPRKGQNFVHPVIGLFAVIAQNSRYSQVAPVVVGHTHPSNDKVTVQTEAPRFLVEFHIADCQNVDFQIADFQIVNCKMSMSTLPTVKMLTSNLPASKLPTVKCRLPQCQLSQCRLPHCHNQTVEVTNLPVLTYSNLA